MPVGETDRERDSPNQNEADSPNYIQVEPASRNELQAQIAVDEPRRTSAGRDHCNRVDKRNDRRRTEICTDKHGGWFADLTRAGGLAKAEIDRNEHQARAMRDRYHE